MLSCVLKGLISVIIDRTIFKVSYEETDGMQKIFWLILELREKMLAGLGGFNAAALPAFPRCPVSACHSPAAQGLCPRP